MVSGREITSSTPADNAKPDKKASNEGKHKRGKWCGVHMIRQTTEFLRYLQA